jgi:hypothetical protein
MSGALIIPFRKYRVSERWLEFMGYQQALMLEYTSGIPTDLISTNSFGGTYQALLRHNFSPSHIPHSLGGDWWRIGSACGFL